MSIRFYSRAIKHLASCKTHIILFNSYGNSKNKLLSYFTSLVPKGTCLRSVLSKYHYSITLTAETKKRSIYGRAINEAIREQYGNRNIDDRKKVKRVYKEETKIRLL